MWAVASMLIEHVFLSSREAHALRRLSRTAAWCCSMTLKVGQRPLTRLRATHVLTPNPQTNAMLSQGDLQQWLRRRLQSSSMQSVLSPRGISGDPGLLARSRVCLRHRFRIDALQIHELVFVHVVIFHATSVEKPWKQEEAGL